MVELTLANWTERQDALQELSHETIPVLICTALLRRVRVTEVDRDRVEG